MRAAATATRPTTTLDRRGKTITTAVVYDAAAAFAHLDEGDVMALLTDEFEPFDHDLAAWCDAAGHRLLGSEATIGHRRYLIAKGTPVETDTSLAMVLSSDGLEELLSPLGFALAAALEGIEVNLFFQGPAVRVLAKGFHPKLKGWARPFSRFAAAGMAKTGHVPAQEKLAQLRSLGAIISVCGPSMEHFKVGSEELIFDDLPVVEYLTFMSVMAGADIHIYS